MRNFNLAVAAALAATLSPTSALAEPAKQPTELIGFADLNLNLKSDQARLEARVRSTVSRLCAEDDRASPTRYLDVRCFNRIYADARLQMDRAIARANGGGQMLALRVIKPR